MKYLLNWENYEDSYKHADWTTFSNCKIIDPNTGEQIGSIQNGDIAYGVHGARGSVLDENTILDSIKAQEDAIFDDYVWGGRSEWIEGQMTGFQMGMRMAANAVKYAFSNFGRV